MSSEFFGTIVLVLFSFVTFFLVDHYLLLAKRGDSPPYSYVVTASFLVSSFPVPTQDDGNTITYEQRGCNVAQ